MEVDSLVCIIHVLPLQAQSLGDAQPGGGYQKRERSFRLEESHHDFEGLPRSDDHRLVVALAGLFHPIDWIGFLLAGNQSVFLRLEVNAEHRPAQFIFRRIRQRE